MDPNSYACEEGFSIRTLTSPTLRPSLSAPNKPSFNPNKRALVFGPPRGAAAFSSDGLRSPAVLRFVGGVQVGEKPAETHQLLSTCCRPPRR